jgi:hypothetical protein
MKIRIASALTKPVITDFETIAHDEAEPQRTRRDLDQAGKHGRREQVFKPVLRTSVTIRTAVAAVAAEIMPGRPP